jgi:hypothetical protein
MAKITFEDKNKFAGQPFNQLKDSEVNEIKASVNALYDGAGGYAVVTELPATIPVGVQLLYNGTMWRGLLEGESSLAAGTPWPVKGYKDFVFFMAAEYGEVSEFTVIKDDWNKAGTPTANASFIKIPYPITSFSYDTQILFGLFMAWDMDFKIIGVEVSYSSTTNEIQLQVPFDIDSGEMQNLFVHLRFYPPAP